MPTTTIPLYGGGGGNILIEPSCCANLAMPYTLKSRAGAMLTRRLNVHQLQPIYEQADKGKALSAGQSCGPIRSIEQLAMKIGNEQ